MKDGNFAMMNENKSLNPDELNEEQLDRATGGIATYLEPNKQELVRVKKCGNQQPHYYDVGLTACPVCHSINFTCEYITKE